MRKIETLFERDPANMKRVINVVRPDCEWVLAGRGVATRKWDGTACAVIAGQRYKRLEWDAKKGPAPPQWIHHDHDPAQRSGHGWFPIGDGPEDWMHRLADWPTEDGTYELIGPKVGKNPEDVQTYALKRHGDEVLDAPRDFEGLREFLRGYTHEGIVWHWDDGYTRMVKIKRKDFW